jgi:hypothetical protein
MKFKQQLEFHLSGEGFSTLTYAVSADDKPTSIIHVIQTKGRSGDFEVESDRFACGDNVFDCIETKKQGLQQWLEKQVNPSAEDPTPGPSPANK